MQDDIALDKRVEMWYNPKTFGMGRTIGVQKGYYMPPRKTSAPAPVETSDEDGEFEEALAESVGSAASIAVDPANPYPAQAYRTKREHHSLAVDHFGQIKAYRFPDVLDFAFTMGFQRFEKPEVTIYPTGGPAGNEPIAVVVACAVFADENGNETFHYGIGDASPSNCNQRVGQAFPRMAETRAQGRALGRGCNLNAVLAEELNEGGNTTTSAPKSQAQTFRSPGPAKPRSNGGGLSKADMANDPAYWPPFNNETGDGFVCEITGEEVSGKGAFWAMDKVGQIVCWDEQQKLLKARG